MYDHPGVTSGGYLYDRMMVLGLERSGDAVDVIRLPRGIVSRLHGGFMRGLQEGRWDVLLQDELCHPSLWFANRSVPARRRCPIVSVVHHLGCREHTGGWRRAARGALESLYLNSVDGFVCVSRSTYENVRCLSRRQRPFVIAYPGRDRNGLSIPAAAPDRKSRAAGRPLRVLFAGNVLPHKGMRELVRALSRLPAGTWRLTVAGSLTLDAGYARAVRSEAVRLGAAGWITFAGAVSDEELSRLFMTHDLLAMPSLHEGFGIVYAEAMGFGIPVIAGASGGAAEIVADGREGFLVPPGDAGALAERLALVSRDRVLLAEMSSRARKRFESLPTWDQTAALVRGFLVNIAGV